MLGTNEAIRPSPALALDSVTRAYGNKIALRDVSLAVSPGEIHALLGPNGSGKTTLIRTLAGLLTPTSGDVTVLSMDASRSPQELRRLIGFIPSGDRSFYLRISGLENLVFFARLHGLRRRRPRPGQDAPCPGRARRGGLGRSATTRTACRSGSRSRGRS